MTVFNVPRTRSGSTSPSEKKTTALRPGRTFRPLTSDSRALVVARPCWSRSSDSMAWSMASSTARRWYSVCRSTDPMSGPTPWKARASPGSSADRLPWSACPTVRPCRRESSFRSLRSWPRSRSEAKRVGRAIITSSRASWTVARSSVKSWSISRPWSIRKTATWRPATAGRLTHSVAAWKALRRASGPRRSKTRATARACSTSGGGGTGAASAPGSFGAASSSTSGSSRPPVVIKRNSSTSCRTPSS